MTPEQALKVVLDSRDSDTEEFGRRAYHWVQRGIHHAQFTAEFGQTPRDRVNAKNWINQATRVAVVIRKMLTDRGVEL